MFGGAGVIEGALEGVSWPGIFLFVLVLFPSSMEGGRGVDNADLVKRFFAFLGKGGYNRWEH